MKHSTLQIIAASILVLSACSDSDEKAQGSDDSTATGTTTEGTTTEGTTTEGTTTEGTTTEGTATEGTATEGTTTEGTTTEGTTTEGTTTEGTTTEGTTTEGTTTEGTTTEGTTDGSSIVGTQQGNTCSDPIVIASLPYAHSADTNAYTDNYSVTNQCGLVGSAGVGTGDIVYQLSTAVTGEYTIQLDADDGTSFIQIASDCADITGSCVSTSLELKGGDSWKVSLSAATTYFLIVDGWESKNTGLFSIAIYGPCIPKCQGKLCGSDGCGGNCGSCTQPQICSQGKCVDFSPSCKDACGQYIPDAPCQCDAGCFDSEDDGCCPNVCTYCSDSFTEQCGQQPGKGSCMNLCGDFTEGADCQCDTSCFGLNDCCPDICTQCFANYPTECSSQ